MTDSFSIAVANTNDAPTITSTAVTSVNEDSAYSYTTTASDVDSGDTVTLTCTTVPSWMSCTDGALTGTPLEAHIGAHSVVITASDGNGGSATAPFTVTVANTNDDPTGSGTITGTAQEDEVLGMATSQIADEDGLGTFSYQWNRAGTAISGATSLTYTLGQDDVDSTITVTVSYTDGHGTAESLTSSATSAVSNVNDDATATISGTATEDETLTASVTDEDGTSGTITYAWNRAGTAISGATSSTYTLTQSDVGSAITVTVSFTDDYSNGETATSSATSAVANVNDDPTGSVTISGTAAEDEVLTAANTLADEDVLGTITYTWSNGDTGSTTTLGQSDVGNTITVTASYTDGQGTAESSTSAATGTVANVNDAGTGLSLASDGDVADPDEDDTLSVSGTLSDEDGCTGTTCALTYAWSTGASSATITLGQSDVGDTISVTLTYTDDQSESNSITLTAASDVDNVNDAPVASTAIDDASTAEDAAYSFDASTGFTDEDGDAMTYTMSGAPSTLSMSTAGVITGTPVNADVGAHTITVTALSLIHI